MSDIFIYLSDVLGPVILLGHLDVRNVEQDLIDRFRAEAKNERIKQGRLLTKILARWYTRKDLGRQSLTIENLIDQLPKGSEKGYLKEFIIEEMYVILDVVDRRTIDSRIDRAKAMGLMKEKLTMDPYYGKAVPYLMYKGAGL